MTQRWRVEVRIRMAGLSHHASVAPRYSQPWMLMITALVLLVAGCNGLVVLGAAPEHRKPDHPDQPPAGSHPARHHECTYQRTTTSTLATTTMAALAPPTTRGRRPGPDGRDRPGSPRREG